MHLQGRHLRRPGEEESDVDIEGFEEDDDGKPKTPAPVREIQLFFVNCPVHEKFNLETSFLCVIYKMFLKLFWFYFECFKFNF